MLPIDVSVCCWQPAGLELLLSGLLPSCSAGQLVYMTCYLHCQEYQMGTAISMEFGMAPPTYTSKRGCLLKAPPIQSLLCLQVMEAISRTFGDSIWDNTMLVLTHGMVQPPDGVKYGAPR